MRQCSWPTHPSRVCSVVGRGVVGESLLVANHKGLLVNYLLEPQAAKTDAATDLDVSVVPVVEWDLVNVCCLSLLSCLLPPNLRQDMQLVCNSPLHSPLVRLRASRMSPDV